MTIRLALTMTSLVALTLVLAARSRADSLPMCPPGTHMVMNPVPPGAMHHGGGRCEPGGPALPTEAPPEAPEAPEAPVGTTPAETPPATPEAALPTAPASTESVPAAPAPSEETSSGLCSVGARGDRSLLVLLGLSLALLLARRRR